MAKQQEEVKQESHKKGFGDFLDDIENIPAQVNTSIEKDVKPVKEVKEKSEKVKIPKISKGFGVEKRQTPDIFDPFEMGFSFRHKLDESEFDYDTLRKLITTDWVEDRLDATGVTIRISEKNSKLLALISGSYKIDKGSVLNTIINSFIESNRDNLERLLKETRSNF